MKYRIENLKPNAAGIFQAPKGWRVHSVLFYSGVLSQPMRVLLEQISES